MRRNRGSFVLLAGLLCATSVFAADPPKQPDLEKRKEIPRLAQEVPKLRAAGQLDEAVAAVE